MQEKSIMFDNIKAIKNIYQGKTVSLSDSQIVNCIINLYDANKNLSVSNYDQVHQKYLYYRKRKEKLPTDLRSYYERCLVIINDFEQIAPYDLYCGDPLQAKVEDAPKSEQPTTKTRYCKYCGGLINNASKKCTKCDRQYFRVKTAFKAIFIFAVIVMCVGLLYYIIPECKYCTSKVFFIQEYYVKDERVCKECFLNSPGCANCLEKHRNSIRVNNKYYCQDCFKKGIIVRCDGCNTCFLAKDIEHNPLLNRNLYIEGNYCKSCKDYNGNTYCGNDFESVWGALLEKNNGELIYDTLTPEQQDLVNYPYLDTDCVYWTVDGMSYHSVRWCYTLDRSVNVFSSSIDSVINREPCSKCVGHY